MTGCLLQSPRPQRCFQVQCLTTCIVMILDPRTAPCRQLSTILHARLNSPPVPASTRIISTLFLPGSARIACHVSSSPMPLIAAASRTTLMSIKISQDASTLGAMTSFVTIAQLMRIVVTTVTWTATWTVAFRLAAMILTPLEAQIQSYLVIKRHKPSDMAALSLHY